MVVSGATKTSLSAIPVRLHTYWLEPFFLSGSWGNVETREARGMRLAKDVSVLGVSVDHKALRAHHNFAPLSEPDGLLPRIASTWGDRLSNGNGAVWMKKLAAPKRFNNDMSYP